MACPMGYGVRFYEGEPDKSEPDADQNGVNKAAHGDGVSYYDYLQVTTSLQSSIIVSLVRQSSPSSNPPLRSSWPLSSP